MSFTSVLKSIFGFGPDEEYTTDPDTADDPDGGASAPESAEAPAEAVEGLTEVPTLPEIDPSVKARIFDGAVAVFNEAMPDFLRRSVDPDRQTRLLTEALDKGLDDYLSGLMLVAEQYAEAKLKGAADTARRDAEKLRADMQLVEQQRANLREQQLSADRRRRALADRVNDLETQLASAEAEREQYELENRSLLNKLKVADIQPGVVDGMAKEIESLKAQLAAAASGAEAQVQSAPDSDSLAEMEELRSAKSALEEELAGVREALTVMEAEKAALQSTAESTARELADSRTQHELSQAMYNDLQNTLSTERQARAQAESALEEARKIVDSVEDIRRQMVQVEEVIRKRDERIERLKATNKKLRERLQEAHESMVASDAGLFALPAETPASATPATEELAAIEDEFECPDWFVSEPAPGEVSPLLQPDPEFGYQEPPKKPRKPENDAQLSLF